MSTDFQNPRASARGAVNYSVSGRLQPKRRHRLGDLADVGLQVLDLGAVADQGFSEIENIESSRWSEFDAASTPTKPQPPPQA